MRKSAILITGANGEMGHGLITRLQKNSSKNIVAIDLNPIDKTIAKFCLDEIIGDILDADLIKQLNNKYKFNTIYHLAALLSTRSEFYPKLAHEINVQGTLNLLNLAIEQGKTQGKTIKFFFPSSIAVYGLKSLKEKMTAGAVIENKFRDPLTMYGCNKLYCEHLGNYYTNNYQYLETEKQQKIIDFRSIRFPGIISSHTIPTGGTSDYLPEMLHAAANNKPYNCFVRENTQIPFMTMPDAIQGIIKLMKVSNENLSQTVYNIRAFAPTAAEFRQEIIKHFSQANIKYNINNKRQKMVDSWPLDTNDEAAKKDWGWSPNHNLQKGLNEYLIPNVNKMYSKKNGESSGHNSSAIA